MEFHLEKTDVTLCGNLGELKIIIDGGNNEPMAYRINNGSWIAMNGNIQLDLPPGHYEVELLHASGCISQIESETILNNDTDFFNVELAGVTPSACPNSGSIELTIIGYQGDYYYSLDMGKTQIPFTTTSSPFTYTIETLATGFYTVIIVNDKGCEFELYNVEIKQGMGNDIAAPEAVTPQTFCTGATVANLQTITGTNITWFALKTGGTPLLPTKEIEDKHIYYAAQTPFGCNRTAVTVIIDNDVFIDAPNIPNEVELCAPATLANVPTNGNTNIMWFDAAVNGNKVPLTTILNDGEQYTFYAALSGGGDCESVQRTEVNITVNDHIPQAPDMETPQYFCPDPLVGNLATPNNQIVWYKPSGTTPLLPDEKLENGWYEATQKAGNCESATRTSVEVIINKYPAPTAPPNQCKKANLTLGDLMITGANIKWYENELGGDALPSNTMVTNSEYWAAQSSGSCESERIKITIMPVCYSPTGTVFPFVYTGDATYDKQFVTTAKLYLAPPSAALDKIAYVRKQGAIRETQVTYYDCFNDTPIVGAPRYPGTIGATNNPGLKINWNILGITTPGPVSNDKLTSALPCPASNMGKYILKDIAPGDYVLEIARQGFLTRYGLVSINNDNYLEHREILGGDLNSDLKIDEKDLSAVIPKRSIYNTPNYTWKYDLTGGRSIDDSDLQVIRRNSGAFGDIYEETEDWLK
jgi:hypothetical protein